MQEEISFGTWLRKQRRALDLTRQAFADEVGCAEVTLRRIEAGTLRPSRELSNLLLDKLGIPNSERSQWISFARGLSGFPLPSKSRSNKPTPNLPAALTSFIGREKEQSDVIRLLTKHRLVTLTGLGGVGKTRLSIKVGERVLGNYADGVWFVEFAPILDPILIPRITAMAIGLRDEPQRPVIDMLSDYLREKEMLIILDNCEHLLDACALLVNMLLKQCPGLKILVTTREPLSILGEAVYRVPSLELPDSQQLLEQFRKYASVLLFEERAQLARVEFSLTLESAPVVAKICTHLDGVPLAIELAAARVGTFSVEQIEERLRESFGLLTTGNRAALPRHKTLQATIDWSYDLLLTEEKSVFQRLSAFVNGWTLDSAQSICSDVNIRSEAIPDLLSQLINKSLVIMDETQDKARYRMLETIRQYANEKLVESGEGDTLRDRHLEYFLNLAEIAEPHLIRPEQLEWLPLLDADFENLRFAFEWSLGKKTAESSLRLSAALGWFFEIRCYWLEGLNWLTRALEKPVRNMNTKEKIARSKTFYNRAMLEWQLGFIKQMRTSAESSFMLITKNSGEKDIAIAKYFYGAALIQLNEEENQARYLLEQSVAKFQELNEPLWEAYSFRTLGNLLAARAELGYRDLYLTNIELSRKAGERSILADALWEYADWLLRVDQVDEAIKYAEESDNLYKQIGAEKASLNPFLFAELAWINGDYQLAKSIYLDLYQRFSVLGEKGFKSNSAGKLGLLMMEEGNLEQARIYLEEALLIEGEAGWKPWEAFYLIALGNLFYQQGNVEQFKQNVRESFLLKQYFPDFHKVYVLMTILSSLYLDNPEVSTRLLGVIRNPERKSDFPRTSVEKRYCIRAEAHAREVLDTAAFDSIFAEGQRMSLDEGLDLALKTVEEM